MFESAKIKYDNMIIKFLPTKPFLVPNLNFFDLKEILHFDKNSRLLISNMVIVLKNTQIRNFQCKI